MSESESCAVSSSTEPDALPESSSFGEETDERPLLFDKISELGLTRKLTEIALAQTKVPPSLREDATQEIHLAWATYRADISLKPGQIASYANRIAHHACLRVRRELGLPVRLPGSAFRRKENGDIQVDLRRFVDPLSWDEIAERVVGRQDNPGADPEGWEHLISYDGTDPDAALSREDEQRVQELYDRMSPRQREVIDALRCGLAFNELAEHFGLSSSLIQRELSAIRKTFQIRASKAA